MMVCKLINLFPLCYIAACHVSSPIGVEWSTVTTFQGYVAFSFFSDWRTTCIFPSCCITLRFPGVTIEKHFHRNLHDRLYEEASAHYPIPFHPPSAHDKWDVFQAHFGGTRSGPILKNTSIETTMIAYTKKQQDTISLPSALPPHLTTLRLAGNPILTTDSQLNPTVTLMQTLSEQTALTTLSVGFSPAGLPHHGLLVESMPGMQTGIARCPGTLDRRVQARCPFVIQT